MLMWLILMTLCRHFRHPQKIRITYVSNSFYLSVIYDVSFWFENRKVVIRLSLLRSDRAVGQWWRGQWATMFQGFVKASVQWSCLLENRLSLLKT